MRGIPTEDSLVFVAIDLNTSSLFDLKNIYRAVLVNQQKTMKDHLTTVRSQLKKMRRQLEAIQILLEERGPT